MTFVVTKAPAQFSHLIESELSIESVAELLELNASDILQRARMASEMSHDGFTFTIKHI